MIPIIKSNLETSASHDSGDIQECWQKFNSRFYENLEIIEVTETYSKDFGSILRIKFEPMINGESAGPHLFVCWKKPNEFLKSFFATAEECELRGR